MPNYVGKLKWLFSQVQPEWFALIHEFSSDDEESSGNSDSSAWMNNLRRRTEAKLQTATESVITPEHRMATVLNPRHKHLPVICSDAERFILKKQTSVCYCDIEIFC